MINTIKVAALLGSFLLSLTASAGTIKTYTDKATFIASVGATTLEDFTDEAHYPIPNGTLDSTTAFHDYHAPLFAGDIKEGATYSTTVGDDYNNGFYFNIDSGGGFTGGFLDSLDPNRSLTITYNPLITAFGFDTNRLMESFELTINFSTGISYTRSFTVSGDDFFGFQSNFQDISSVNINGGGPIFGFGIDNHIFGGTLGTVSAVPEPETYAMFLGGLGVISFVTRRRKS